MGILKAARTELNAVVPGLPLGDILLGNVGDFKRGFVFEVIDSRTGKALMTKSLVMNPRRYTISEPFAVTLTPTEDNTVVAEENGIIIREIVIEGTTGLEKKVEDALGRGGSIGTEASGVDHFYQLRDVFREYSQLKKDPRESPYIQMVFHNVKEDDHFLVVPRSFETPRDAASNRLHFNYRISLAAIQESPPPKPQADFLADLLGGGETLRNIAEAVNDARTFMVEAIDVIETYRGRIRDPEAFLESVALTVNAGSELVSGATSTISVGVEFVAAVNDLVEDIQETLENDIDGDPSEDELREARRLTKMRNAMTRIQQHREKFSDPLAANQARVFAGDRNLTQDDLDNNLAGATKGSRTRVALGSEKNAGIDLGGFTGSRKASIGATDTIDIIANRERVPREAIIALNNLRFPYITRGGGPGTLKPGDDIMIPVRTSGRQTSPTPSDAYLTPDDILYGVDLALDKDLAEVGVFDIAIDEAHGSTDALLVRGLDNAVQGINITISTEFGSTVYIPDLGIKRTPGIKGTVANMLLASLYLREAILSDPRVRGIDSQRIVKRGDVLSQEITPELVGARDGVTIITPFGKAAE